VRLVCLALALALSTPLAAQEEKKAVKKKPVAAKAKKPKAHQKPTPEQIRKFNELQKKQ
jgi:hypothetical protein